MFSSHLPVPTTSGNSHLKSSLFALLPLLPCHLLPQETTLTHRNWQRQGALMIFLSNCFWKRALDSWHHLTCPKACIHVVWGKSAQINLQAYKGHHIAQQRLIRRGTDVHFAILGLSSTHSANNFAIGLICPKRPFAKADSLKESQQWYSNHGQNKKS